MDSDQKPTRSFRRQIVYIAIITAVITIPSVLFLFVSSKIEVEVFFDNMRKLVSDQHQIENFFAAFGAVSIQLFLLIVGIALLFHLGGIKQKTIDSISQRWIWKHFLKHVTGQAPIHFWHIYLGYFLLLLALAPVLGENMVDPKAVVVLDPDENPISIDEETSRELLLYSTMITTIPMLAAVLLITRVLSKLQVKILASNIGIFILAIFISESIFMVAAGRLPLALLYSIVDPSSNSNIVYGGMQIYFYIFIGSVFISIADWGIVEHLVPYLENRFKKPRSSPSQ